MAIRVAVFEDNKLVRDSFETILNGTDGFTCTGAFSSCNNLRSDIERSRPDIVLMDIEMSGMNGIEATKKIKDQYPEIKILIQTVFEDDEKIFAAICAGASGYMIKKTTPTKLIDALQEVYDGGAPMSPGIATRVLALFQKFAPPQQQSNDESGTLSKREKEILLLMMEGDNYHTIAKKIFLSYDTVRTHVRSIYKKLHVASVNQAIVKAFKQRLI
ncbi:MAG TPA: response regulator transcription factor [Chitinophagaceae bacterium]|jgi:DNA-binding NarL/FixJ family response regulator|nr:response regulator transcription factor [Chitinophagaceae bacterium]